MLSLSFFVSITNFTLVAKVAQLVEQLICNQPVVGSSPIFGSRFIGSVPEWLKGVDCKSTGYAYNGSNPFRPKKNSASVTQLVECHPSKVDVEGSSPFARSIFCPGSSVVEHFLGKEEVSSSILDLGSMNCIFYERFYLYVKI